MEGRGGLGGGGKRGREGEWGRRRKGEVGGIATWLLGDRRPWLCMPSSRKAGLQHLSNLEQTFHGKET